MHLESTSSDHDAVTAAHLDPLIPATPRGEATRRKLMSAAEEEFGSKGFHVASVSSITTRAGVGQGTFYLYFRTKEEIFVTLVRDIGRNLRRHMRNAVGATSDRIEAERQGMEAFFDFACRQPGLYRIVQESQFVDEGVFREYYERIAKAYAADLEAATNRGELRPGDPEVRAWALMGAGHFLSMRHCLWAGQVPLPAAVDGLMDLVANGMANPA